MSDPILPEPWSLRKWLCGFINPLNFGKSIVQVWWIGILLLLIYGLSLVGGQIKNAFWPKKNPPAPFTVTVAEGSKVDRVVNSNDQKKSEFSLFRLW